MIVVPDINVLICSFLSPGIPSVESIRFKRIAALVRPEPTPKVIEEDPADNRVLECAADAGASHVVSGDDHLFGTNVRMGGT